MLLCKTGVQSMLVIWLLTLWHIYHYWYEITQECGILSLLRSNLSQFFLRITVQLFDQRPPALPLKWLGIAVVDLWHVTLIGPCFLSPKEAFGFACLSYMDLISPHYAHFMGLAFAVVLVVSLYVKMALKMLWKTHTDTQWRGPV